eukprot:CAMPEP_0176419578 /NCGR_PEP_ID=MMETSP0127-20121128/8129_1 /TAXON_ID=938130 /ORGANISM="Platyophrya macrostoma, Strain WH" /LENGTH=589 /DNA_ID=CAMNT_0017800079 /DNA_START=6 /DNA_END=1775 /DNA_ORIENTATION=-
MSARLRAYIQHLQESKDEQPFTERRQSLVRKDRVLGIALKVALAIFVVLFVLYLWFLFTIYPQERTAWVQREKQSHGDSSSQIASELIQLATLKNFTNFEEKSKFLEKELNERLEKFGLSKKGEVPSFKYTNLSSIPTGKEIAGLFSIFLKSFNDFKSGVSDANELHKLINEQTERYNIALDKLQTEKKKLFELMKDQDRVARAKDVIDQQIEDLKSGKGTTAETKQDDLSEERRHIEEKQKEADDYHCQEIAAKLDQIKKEQATLEINIQKTLERIIEIDMAKLESKDRIISLEWLIRSKEGHLNVTLSDHKSVSYLQNLLTETKELQAKEELVLPVKSALKILSKNYQIFQTTKSQHSEAELRQMRASYLAAAKHFKQQVRILVNNHKSLNEERVELEDSLKGRDSLETLEHKIKTLRKDIEKKKAELEAIKSKEGTYEQEKEALRKKSETIEAEKKQKEKEHATEADKNTDCSKILKQLEAYQRAYNKKKQELADSLNDLQKRINVLEENSRERARELAATQRDIYDFQLVFSNILHNLSENQAKLADNTLEFTDKDLALSRLYNDLMLHKKNLIDKLSKVEIQSA